jgi:hypothetical protein
MSWHEDAVCGMRGERGNEIKMKLQIMSELLGSKNDFTIKKETS